MNDTKSQALLTTALHPSSTPNEKLTALSALGRIMARAGIHPSDVSLATSVIEPRDERQATATAQRREIEIAALARRLKAQEKVLRAAVRETQQLQHRVAELERMLVRKDEMAADDICQIAALEADLAARDRRIAALEARNHQQATR